MDWIDDLVDQVDGAKRARAADLQPRVRKQPKTEPELKFGLLTQPEVAALLKVAERTHASVPDWSPAEFLSSKEKSYLQFHAWRLRREIKERE